MSTIIKTGWLQDSNGDTFAPKTLMSQVQASDGMLLEDKIQAMKTEIQTKDKEYIEQTSIDFISTELAKRAQLKPEFANSVDECIDTRKLYVLPDGYIWAYVKTTVELGETPNFTNRLTEAINADGSDYVGLNGEDGYKVGYRVGSSGAEKEATTCCCTGFIKISKGDTIRVKNFKPEITGYGCLYFFSSTSNSPNRTVYTNTNSENVMPDSNGILTVTSNGDGYFRLTAKIIDQTTIITVNEEITYTQVGTHTTYHWVNTGHAFVPADYEDRISDIENELQRVSENGNGNRMLLYIAPDGNDNNSGLTAYTPKKTVKACVNVGATRISAKRGVYNEHIQFSDIDELEIFPTDNEKEFVLGEDREPIVFEMVDRYTPSNFAAYNSIKRMTYSNTANTQFDKVFTKQSQPPVVGDGYGSRYNSTIWLLSEDEKMICVKLKPVLTIAECELETNTFTYVDGYIYINADMTNVAQIVVPTIWETGFYINKAQKIILREVEVRFSGSYNIDLRNCVYFDLYKCACKYTSYGSGFHPFNSNGVMTACYATKNYDGYGISGHGHTTYIDCVSEFNFDDGMSHHNACEGTVIGGRYEGNGKAGNAPAYGAKVNIYGGIYKDNNSFGIGYLHATESGAASGMVQGAILVGNATGLIVQANCPVTAISCVYKNNEQDKDIKGILTEY